MRRPSSSTASLEGASTARVSLATPRFAWSVVGLLWVAFLINYIDRQVVFSIFPALRSELGFSSAQLGLIGSLFIWVYSLCSPLAGRIADLFRRERVIVASLILWSLATLATGRSGSVGVFLFWRAVMGVTEGLYVPAALSLIGGFHPGPTRSRALAIHASAQVVGIIAGGWFGGWMADHTGWRAAFTWLAAVGLLYAPVLVLFFRRLPGLRTERKQDRARPGDILRSRCYLALAVAFFALCAMLWMFYAWLPSFIYERYRLSMAESGLMATLYLQSSTIAGLLSGGALADWAVKRAPAGRFYISALGLLLCAPFAWLTLAVRTLALLKIASAGFGFFAAGMMANIFASSYDVVAERNYGLAAGTLNMIGGVAGGLAMFFAGIWKESFGIEALMLWVALAAAASAVLLMIVVRRRFEADRLRARIAFKITES